MHFKLEITLNNDEAVQMGPHDAVEAYLTDTAYLVKYNSSNSGLIMDGNGNRIGQWEFTEITAED